VACPGDAGGEVSGIWLTQAADDRPAAVGPDDRLQRVSGTPRDFDSITNALEYWIVCRSLSPGAHSRDPVADDDDGMCVRILAT
jgi:hypothetical protein